MALIDLVLDDLLSLMPMSKIIECLDDDGDGQADMKEWNEVVKHVNERLVELLGSADAVRNRNPRSAAKVFAAYKLYSRRGFYGKENPFTSDDEKAAESLTGSVGGGTVITAPSAFDNSQTGRVVS